jgi:diguanylate cyclase (GGDEF)-like protein
MAFSGTVVVIDTILWGGHSFAAEEIRYGGIPWVLGALGLGLMYGGRTHDLAKPLAVPFYGAALLVGIGVGNAALATGDGALAPIIGGLYLKVLFDTSTFRRRQTLRGFAILTSCWALVLALGPPQALWAAPFQAVLLVGAFAIGTIGYNAFVEATRARLLLANTDDLTRLLNRRGFETSAERALARSAEGDRSFAVIVLDLDDFKSINDGRGHAAGDQVLQAVAGVMTKTLPDAYAIGRIGGDEFTAAVPARSAEALKELAAQLDEQLAAVTSCSIGGATFDQDGDSLDALLRVADHRAYAVKQRRSNRQPATAAEPMP